MRKTIGVISMLMALLVLGSVCFPASAASVEGIYQTVGDIEDAFRETYMMFLSRYGGVNADTALKAAITSLSFGLPEVSEEHDGLFVRSLRTEDGEFSFSVFTKENSDIVEGALMILDDGSGDGSTRSRNGALIYGTFISLVSKERGSDPVSEIMDDFESMLDEAYENGYSEYRGDVYSFLLTLSNTDWSWILKVTHVESNVSLAEDAPALDASSSDTPASDTPASGTRHTLDDYQKDFIACYRAYIRTGSAPNADPNATVRLFPFTVDERHDDGSLTWSVQTDSGNFILYAFTHDDSNIIDGVLAYLVFQTVSEAEMASAIVMLSAVFSPLFVSEEEEDPYGKGFALHYEMYDEAMNGEEGTAFRTEGQYMFIHTVTFNQEGAEMMVMAAYCGD